MATACKHPRVRIVSRHEDTEYVECLECGEVFDSEEFHDMEIEETADEEAFQTTSRLCNQPFPWFNRRLHEVSALSTQSGASLFACVTVRRVSAGPVDRNPCIMQTRDHGQHDGRVESHHAQHHHPGRLVSWCRSTAATSADLGQGVGLAEDAGTELAPPTAA